MTLKETIKQLKLLGNEKMRARNTKTSSMTNFRMFHFSVESSSGRAPYCQRHGLVPLLIAMCLGMASTSPAQTLLFKSGFEPDSNVVSTKPGSDRVQNDDIIGRDQSLPAGVPSDWVADFERNPRMGSFVIQYETIKGGAHARIIDDPTGSNRGKVLEFWLRYPSPVKGRIQTNVYGNPPDLNEVTSITKMYLPKTLGEALKTMPEQLTWFTLQENWNNPSWGGGGTELEPRIAFGISKLAGVGRKLFWHAYFQDAKGGREALHWRYNTYDRAMWVDDILGQWVTLLMYHKNGNATTGRYRVKVIKADGSEQELFNVTNWTMHPRNGKNQTGLTHHNPHKLYTSKATVNHIRENTTEKAAVIYWG